MRTVEPNVESRGAEIDIAASPAGLTEPSSEVIAVPTCPDGGANLSSLSGKLSVGLSLAQNPAVGSVGGACRRWRCVLKMRLLKDRSTAGAMFTLLIVVNSFLFLLAAGLLLKAKPILDKQPLLRLLSGSSWHPMKGAFGFFPFIVGTLEVTACAMLIAVPIALLSAVYLSEYAGKRLRSIVCPLIDVLAGIPSVIFGLCGVIVVVPFVRFIGTLTGSQTTGYSLLAGAIILAIMVLPVIVCISTELLRSIRSEARETALSLGTTRWEMVKFVLLKIARRGIVASIVLGFARAFGETMAVLMVVGNVVKVPRSLFDSAYTLPALIANNYGEVMSIPMYDSALMLAALILLFVVAAFNFTAHLTLSRMERRA
jgi:phosphate transport system permease protein